MDEIRSALSGLERDPVMPGAQRILQAQRAKLLLLDEAYRAEFTRVDSILRGGGMPPDELETRLARWRNFTAEYRSRMRGVSGQLDSLAHASLTKSAIAAVLRSFGDSAIAPVATVRSAPAPAVVNNNERRAAVPQDTTTDLPTSDDLAETTIVKLSPDIRALAASLGNSPAAIYAYVYNHAVYVPYPLLMLNSEAVLWAGRGNDADEATLLIALLRAANIPARYVTADIDIPVADAANWVGAKDRAGAATILQAATAFTDLGDHFNILHTWVEAWIDTGGGSGPGWVALDPSIKKHTFQPGLLLPVPAFDRANFLSRPPSQLLASELYAGQIHTAMAQAFPGHDYNELPYAGTLIPAASNALPSFAYTPTTVFRHAAAEPSNTLWTMAFTLTDNKGSTVYLKGNFNLPDICLQALTISFTPATAADQAIVTKFGGLGNAPAGTVNLLAQVRLDENVVATGTVPVPNLNSVTLNVTQTGPNDTKPRYTETHSTTAGWNIALNLVTPANGDALIANRTDALLSSLNTASPDTIVRATLVLAANIYYRHKEQAGADLFGPLQFAQVYDAPYEAVTASAPLISDLFDRPYLAVGSTMLVDEQLNPVFYADLNATPAARDKTSVAQAYGVTISQLEEQLWEEMVLIQSACTVNVLQTANQQGIGIVTFNQSNASAVLPTLPALPSVTMTRLNSDIANGDSITIPQKLVAVYGFNGIAWIADPPTGGSIFRIQNIGGGTTGGGTPVSMPVSKNAGDTGDPTPIQGTTCSDPVSVSNGNMYQQQTDLTLSGRGPAVTLTRTYNSFAAATSGPFGYGWTHSYAMSLKDQGTAVTFVNGSGGVYTFNLQNGVYVSPPGPDLSLTKDSSGYKLREPHGTVWFFNLSGALQSITDRNRNSTTLAYDGGGRLVTLTSASGLSVVFQYDAANRIVAVQDSTGRTVNYAYDAAGNLAGVTDPAGNRTTYAYYGPGVSNRLLQQTTRPAGNWTAFEYYANGQTARISDSAGRNTRFLYLPLHGETIVVDTRGFTTSYYYNALGSVTRVVKPDGAYRDTAFTPDAKPASVTDESGFTAQFTYDSTGNLLKATDALGNAISLAYEPNFNLVSSYTDALGAQSKFQYDSQGNLLQATTPLGEAYTFTYDSSGDVLTATDAAGNVIAASYDSAGNLAQLTGAMGETSSFAYDALRRLTAFTDALNRSWSVTYDALGRLVSSTDPAGHSATLTYDGNGNVAKAADPNGNTTSFSYDSLDHLTKVTDALGNATAYGYSTPDCGCSSGDDLISFSDAAGHTLAMAYDFDGRLTQSADASGAITAFAYTSRGDLRQKTDANGNRIVYQYDADGRLTGKLFPDGSTAKFTYDANGNLTAAVNANASLTFTYDADNRLTSVTDSRFSSALQYSYAANGRLASLTDPLGGVTTYSWNPDRRLTAVTAPSGSSVAFSYDVAGERSTAMYSNGIPAAYTWDSTGRLAQIGFPASLPSFTYTYDAKGNPSSVNGQAYQYDALNRVTGGGGGEAYSYDAAGNRLSSQTGAGYSYDPAGHLLAAEGGAYSYDKNGNPISRTDPAGITTFSYDFENQLTGIVFPDGTSAQYLYDALGRRIQKTVRGATVQYAYDGAQVLLELDPNGAMLARYTQEPGAGSPLLMERAGQTYSLLYDRGGSVSAVADSSGTPVCTYSYDSFGRSQPCTALTAPYGFAGREFDSETGLYYMRARYYDPRTGRFITQDPLNLPGLAVVSQSLGNAQAVVPWAPAHVLGLNLLAGSRLGFETAAGIPQRWNSYAYAANNPLAYRDPSGLQCSSDPSQEVEQLQAQAQAEHSQAVSLMDNPITAATGAALEAHATSLDAQAAALQAPAMLQDQLTLGLLNQSDQTMSALQSGNAAIIQAIIGNSKY